MGTEPAPHSLFLSGITGGVHLAQPAEKQNGTLPLGSDLHRPPVCVGKAAFRVSAALLAAGPASQGPEPRVWHAFPLSSVLAGQPCPRTLLKVTAG